MPHKNMDSRYLLSRIFVRCKEVKTDYSHHCWEHQHNTDTYVSYKIPDALQHFFKTKTTLLHRAVYAVWYNTALDSSDVIMHLCNNRKCVNPLHLKLGTHKENNWRNQPK